MLGQDLDGISMIKLLNKHSWKIPNLKQVIV